MKNNARWFRLALGVVTLLFAGIIYAWSIIKAPLAEEFGWDAPSLAFNFTLTMCFFCLGGLISGLLSKKLSPRIRLIASAVFLTGGFITVSQITGSSIIPLYIAYGIFAGTGIGIAYNVIISCTNAWFPDKKGLSSGWLMMGFGFSTLVLGNAANKLFSVASIGWRGTYIILGSSIGAILLLASFFTKMPEAKPDKSKAVSSAAVNDFTSLDMMKRLSFWKLFIFFILFASVGSSAISFAKDFSQFLGASAEFSVTIVGILSICNGLGRLVSGTIFDKLGLRKTQYITSGVVTAAVAISLIGILAGSLAVGVTGLCLCGFSYGFSPTVSAAFSGAFYGPKNFALNFSILNLILIPASFVPTLAGSLYASTGSYVTIFVILIVFSAVGMLINLSIKKA